MLPKDNKISRFFFPTSRENGRSYHTPTLTLRVYINSTSKKPNTNNFSFIVSKKVSKNATQRNFLKRRGYAVIRKNLMKIKEGSMFIFYFKKEALSLSYSQIEGEIISLLKKSSSYE